MNFTQIDDWGFNLSSEEPLIIAGPCSAESRDQMLQISQDLPAKGVHILRAGIWKPRSKPNSFQGIGTAGLEWLKEASLNSGIPCTTEVATTDHVQQALKAGIDILWIGARTTVNPFYIQEIAESLNGVDIPVMIKNPINPDLDLWIGGIERLYQAGIHKILAIHRGFSTFKPEKYRNPPMWEIPIELKRRFPNLPLICDPSHIAGNDKLVAEISQMAFDLDFDGLMIEVHQQPDKALSDNDQQLNPKQLEKILSELVIKHADSQNIDFKIKIDQLRAKIDELDNEIISLLAKRMQTSRDIGLVKVENGVTIFQMDRWAHLYEDRVKSTITAGLSEKFAKDFIQSVHKESIHQQLKGIKDQSSQAK